MFQLFQWLMEGFSWLYFQMCGFNLSSSLHLHYTDIYACIETEKHRGPKIITREFPSFPSSFELFGFTLNWEQGGWGGLGQQVWQERERQGYEEGGWSSATPIPHSLNTYASSVNVEELSELKICTNNEFSSFAEAEEKKTLSKWSDMENVRGCFMLIQPETKRQILHLFFSSNFFFF